MRARLPILHRASASERAGPVSPEGNPSASALREGKMELDELLLDEEGAFSLSGFQEFTVSVRGPARSWQALGVTWVSLAPEEPHEAARSGPV